MNDTSIGERNLANYDTAWSVAEYTREQDLRPIERELVNMFMQPKSRILDLGCGAGRTTVGLARDGYDPVAIDVSDTLLAEARRRYPALDFRHMDVTQLDFEPESFDGALFSYNGLDCLYPLEARRGCLAEVFRVLKPGAAFVFSSHNFVGSVFSGGYLYLRGYLNAIGALAAQVGNPHLRAWYVKYHDGGGPQLLYSAPPDRTVAQLQGAGFDVLDVRGARGERDPRRIRWRQQHVHFVARKPRP